MKKARWIILAFFTVVTGLDFFSDSVALGAPIRISQVTEIRKFTQSGDWLFFDIDDTLLTLDSAEIDSVQLTDLGIPAFLQELATSGHKCLVLTARDYDRFFTEQQLLKFEINLDRTFEPYRSSDGYTGFRNGIIFAGGSISKGDTLIIFLKHLRKLGHNLPNRMIFADDFYENLTSVEGKKDQLLSEFGIQDVLTFQIVPPSSR